jgi:hypothetical protein
MAPIAVDDVGIDVVAECASGPALELLDDLPEDQRTAIRGGHLAVDRTRRWRICGARRASCASG